MSERLQKTLARAGLGSRRSCEALIRAGRVRVNDRTASIGQQVDPSQDKITVDDKLLHLPSDQRYLKLHKPAGYLCSTRSQGGSPTIYDLISIPERVFPAGRLDKASEGLVLLTNDGEMTQRLTHPSFEHEKEYRVLFSPTPSTSQIDQWQAGLMLPDGYQTQPSSLFPETGQSTQSWFRVVLREGRKRQIRAMATVLGLSVLRLIRLRIGSLELGTLEAGKWEECTPGEIQALRRLTG